MNEYKNTKIEFIAMPSFISIIDVEHKYLAVSDKSTNLMNLDIKILPKLIGSRCQNLVNIPVEKIDNPIDQGQSNKTLIKLEVTVHENSARLQQIEKIVFMGDSPLITKIKELEVHQINDNKNWEEFEDNKDKIEKLSRMATIITNIPGGLKSWFMIFIIFQMIGIFFIDIGIRVFNLESIVPIVPIECKK